MRNPLRTKSAKYGLDSIISALFMRNHLKTWQIGIEIHKPNINLEHYILETSLAATD